MDATIPLYPTLQRYSLGRALDWRFRRAHSLVERGQSLCRRRGDEGTGRAVRYLRVLHRHPGERGLKKAARADPDLHHARRLHEEAGPFQSG